MNRLSSFNDFALTRSEMKGVRGGCGSTCCQGNNCDQSPNYGGDSKDTATKAADECAQSGGRGYWCCASC